ncbi:MAG TPA: hypothetical protein VI524_15815 [Anaerolineales bacterium]|nr:hypothetical protein [Anaerolineales bacterium]
MPEDAVFIASYRNAAARTQQRIVFAFPFTTTALPWQVKVNVWLLSVTRIAPELAGGSWMVGAGAVREGLLSPVGPGLGNIVAGQHHAEFTTLKACPGLPFNSTEAQKDQGNEYLINTLIHTSTEPGTKMRP